MASRIGSVSRRPRRLSPRIARSAVSAARADHVTRGRSLEPVRPPRLVQRTAGSHARRGDRATRALSFSVSLVPRRIGSVSLRGSLSRTVRPERRCRCARWWGERCAWEEERRPSGVREVEQRRRVRSAPIFVLRSQREPKSLLGCLATPFLFSTVARSPPIPVDRRSSPCEARERARSLVAPLTSVPVFRSACFSSRKKSMGREASRVSRSRRRRHRGSFRDIEPAN